MGGGGGGGGVGGGGGGGVGGAGRRGGAGGRRAWASLVDADHRHKTLSVHQWRLARSLCRAVRRCREGDDPRGLRSGPDRCRPRRRTYLGRRSEEHTSELQSLMRISYAVFCLKKKNKTHN